MRRVLPFALTGLLALTSLACSSSGGGGGGSNSAATAIAALTGDQTNGKSIYGNQCASCHAADGSGGVGSSLIAPPKSSLSAEAMIVSLLDGKGNMPSFSSSLTEQQMADVIAYVRGNLKAGK